MSRSRGFFQDTLGQLTGGILGPMPSAQPPVRGAPVPVPRPTERGTPAPSQTNRLFQNKAFLSALNSFGQALAQPGTVPGQAINTGQRLTQGLGAFNQQFAQQQQAAQLAQQEKAKQALAGRFIEAKIGQLNAPPTLTPFQRQSLELRKQEIDKPSSPLVTIGGKAETEGQKVLSKASAENVITAQKAGALAQDIIFSSNRLQGAIDRGAVGKLAEPKAFLTEVATAFGLEVSPQELEKAVDVRAVNRILGDKALDKLANLKGSTSERDLRFGRTIAGRVSEGKGSVQEVADLMKAGAIKAQQISEIANNAILAGGKPRDISIEINRAKNSISLEDIFEQVKQDRLKRVVQTNTSFDSIESAEAAKLPAGTQITINGRRAVVE